MCIHQDRNISKKKNFILSLPTISCIYKYKSFQISSVLFECSLWK